MEKRISYECKIYFKDNAEMKEVIEKLHKIDTKKRNKVLTMTSTAIKNAILEYIK